MPFVQVGTYPDKEFRTLGPLSLRPPFTGASIGTGRASGHCRSFSEILESPRCAPHSAKLSEKRMHYLREKRDKPPGQRFHAGKRLSEKRDKREKTYPPSYSFSVCASAV